MQTLRGKSPGTLISPLISLPGITRAGSKGVISATDQISSTPVEIARKYCNLPTLIKEMRRNSVFHKSDEIHEMADAPNILLTAKTQSAAAKDYKYAGIKSTKTPAKGGLSAV